MSANYCWHFFSLPIVVGIGENIVRVRMYWSVYRMKSGLKRNPAHHLMEHPSSTGWLGKYDQNESDLLLVSKVCGKIMFSC